MKRPKQRKVTTPVAQVMTGAPATSSWGTVWSFAPDPERQPSEGTRPLKWPLEPDLGWSRAQRVLEELLGPRWIPPVVLGPPRNRSSSATVLRKPLGLDDQR